MSITKVIGAAVRAAAKPAAVPAQGLVKAAVPVTRNGKTFTQMRNVLPETAKAAAPKRGAKASGAKAATSKAATPNAASAKAINSPRRAKAVAAFEAADAKYGLLAGPWRFHIRNGESVKSIQSKIDRYPDVAARHQSNMEIAGKVRPW